MVQSQSLTVLQNELDTVTKRMGWCWSIGTTRITPGGYECRAFPRTQNTRVLPSKDVIFTFGRTVEDAVIKCLQQIKERS